LEKQRKKGNKSHVIIKIISQMIIVFIIATSSIVLYDMYINIEVENEGYLTEKVSREISTKNTRDISTMLEEVSKSVVRNI